MTAQPQEPARPVRVALLGYGYAGRTFHAPLLRAQKAWQLMVVGSSQPATVHADLGDVTVLDYHAAACHDDVDMVVIATPNQSHASLATTALQAGKHVVVDKPFAIHVAEARALTRLAHSQGRVLSVFHNRRWDSDFLGLQAALASGRLRTPVVLESRLERFRPMVRQRWRESDEPGSGLLFDLGPHLMDQALCLFGIPQRINGHMARQRLGARSEDWFLLRLDYGRLQVVLQAGMLCAAPVPRFTLLGEQGAWHKMKPDPQEGQLRAGLSPASPEFGQDHDPGWFSDGTGALQAVAVPNGQQGRYYQLLAAALHGQGSNPVSPEQGCAVMVMLQAARDSAAKGGCAVMPAVLEAERCAFALLDRDLDHHPGAGP